MLWEWHSPSAASFLAEEVADEPPDNGNDVELWDREEDGEQPLVSPCLESPQRADLHNLLEEYGDILNNRTPIAEHRIHTGTAPLI